MKKNSIVVGSLFVLRVLLKIIPFIIDMLDKSSDSLAEYLKDSNETKC